MRLLITGASGHLAKRVITHLLETHNVPASRIIAATRKPDRLAELAAQGVEVRAADFDDASSLSAAFGGAGRLLLISTDALDAPGRRIAQHRAAVQTAERAGIKHIVYTSGPSPAPDGSIMDDHYWTEHAIAQSQLEWTILRNNLYTEILLMALPHAVAWGQLVTATGTGGRSYVTREDCARTAAAALASLTGRQILDVTGPAAVTQTEIAAIASELTGRTVSHISVSPEDLRKGLLAANTPPSMADALVTFDVAASQGYHAIVTSTVKDLTGREPISARDFLMRERPALLPHDSAA